MLCLLVLWVLCVLVFTGVYLCVLVLVPVWVGASWCLLVRVLCGIGGGGGGGGGGDADRFLMHL